MTEPLLNVMKIMLLAGLYLFFVRVLWSVYSELRDPRTIARSSRPSRASAPAKATSGASGSAATFAAAAGTANGAGVAVTARTATAELVIIDPPRDAGTRFALGREITIGRAPTNGIIVDDTYVSNVHARIFKTTDGYFIEDLASRNGSTLNGGAIVATTALLPGDRVQVGATTMEFT